VTKYFKWLWNNCVVGKASEWQALCAVVLCVFTFLLYRVSDRATETSRASERAFINFGGPVMGVRLVGPDGKWSGQEIALMWANAGNTPAKAVVMQQNTQTWRSDLPTGYAFPETRANSLAVIGPKANYGTLVNVSKVDLTDAWQGQSRIFFWGTVLYQDTFPGDADRLSEFCVEMTHVSLNTLVPLTPTPPSTPASNSVPQPVQPVQTVPDTLTGFQWQACREHNCYDEDCKDYKAKIKEMRQQ